jgi:hypothetical protein
MVIMKVSLEEKFLPKMRCVLACEFLLFLVMHSRQIYSPPQSLTHAQNLACYSQKLLS